MHHAQTSWMSISLDKAHYKSVRKQSSLLILLVHWKKKHAMVTMMRMEMTLTHLRFLVRLNKLQRLQYKPQNRTIVTSTLSLVL